MNNDPPKTIDDYQGKSIAVQLPVWQICLQRAKRERRKATEIKRDPKWEEKCSGISRKWIIEATTKPVRERAIEIYRYWRHRATFRVEGRWQKNIAIDPTMEREWLEAGGTLE